MTRRYAFVLLVIAAVVGGPGSVTSGSAALPTGCIAIPLPTTPIPPTYTTTIRRLTDQASLELWRQPCASDPTKFVALVRITPITTGPFICGVNFLITQGGTQFQGWLTTSQFGSGFCNDLPASQTLILIESPIETHSLNAANAFTLVHDGVTSTQQLEVPSLAGPLPPSVLIVSTGCNPCHSGQVVAFNMNFANPGPPVSVEIKGGVRLPDGSILPFVNQVSALPSGGSTLPLVPPQALPGGLPTIDVVVEAAILDPLLGVTLSRHNVTLHLLP